MPSVLSKSCLRPDDRNFYGIFSIIISSKMTKTDPNTKENLQKQKKNIKTESKMPKDKKKAQKMKKMSIPSQHDVSHRATMGAACLLAKKTEEINLKKICPSQHDIAHRSTMTYLVAQVDEMHKISYKNELNLHIAAR
ncbi:hypothetical protein QL285_019897 [Trifolium repens]|nr:hypothetical protein QL285_019897 [Trifolium repens]